MKRAMLIMPIIFLIILTFCFSSYAESNMIYGCYKKIGGQLRIVNRTNRCLPSEIAISWNKTGPSGLPGPAGLSVESTSLPEGDPNCPNGGSRFTSVSGVTYACNGEGGGEEGERSPLMIRHLQTEQCASDGYGWCPDGFRKWVFRIRDANVTEKSVIAINIINPKIPQEIYRECELSTIRDGEFVILCGGWTYVESGAILNYAIFNP